MSGSSARKITVLFVLCAVLAATLAIAGCTGTTGGDTTTVPTPVTTAATTVATAAPTPASNVSGDIIAFTAASLTGVSKDLGPAFEAAYPGTTVTFNLQGTQSLKKQIEMGAEGDVFISAKTAYTNTLMGEGYLDNDTVKKLTSNYIVVIVPAGNPGNITSLADLSKPGVKIAMGTEEVPVGINTRTVINKLANSTLVPEGWKDGVFNNVVTYETTEPGVVTKVSLGEVDAGFVYESSYKAAAADTLELIPIPEEDNSLQIYTIGVLSDSTNKETAQAFVNFLLSDDGQEILKNYGFTPIS